MSDLLQQVWACEESALVDYLSRRESSNLAGLDPKNEAFVLGAPSRDAPLMAIADGVATINIEGVLSKGGPDWIDQLLGLQGTSYREIEKALGAAVDSPLVQLIQLAIDSPGGEVFGVDEARGAIARAAKAKLTLAINTGMVASAAYWLASAANKIISTSPVNMTGSIGVVAVAIDRSDRDRQRGVVTVVSRNAPDKRPDMSTDAGRAVIQDQVDALERAFIERVAEGRGISADTVRATFGRGRMLVAIDPDSSKPSALSVGMIDEVINGFGVAGVAHGSAKAASGEAIDVAAQCGEATIEAPHCAAKEEQDMSAELQARIAELEATLGKTTAAQSDLESRMTAVAPILASNVYPAVVKEIAARVLSGHEHPKALEGAIAMFDAQHAGETVEDAKQASAEAKSPEHRALESATPADGTISSAAALEAAVLQMRAQLGKE